MKEIWKSIKGYENLYEVSNTGKVKSKYRKGKILKQSKNTHGYLQVNLWKDKQQKSVCVHRLVAEQFVDNPQSYNQVNHKDENKHNNCALNLEWCNGLYNTNYGTRNKRTSKSKGRPIVCVELNIIFCGMRQASKETNIPYQRISECCNNKRKEYAGYHFEFIK